MQGLQHGQLSLSILALPPSHGIAWPHPHLQKEGVGAGKAPARLVQHVSPAVSKHRHALTNARLPCLQDRWDFSSYKPPSRQLILLVSSSPRSGSPYPLPRNLHCEHCCRHRRELPTCNSSAILQEAPQGCGNGLVRHSFVQGWLLAPIGVTAMPGVCV